MAKHIKTFPCGHRGLGRSCRWCIQQAQHAEQEAAIRAAQQQQKNDWKQRFTTDPIDLRGLPRSALVRQARHVIDALAQGQDYRAFGGKKLAKCPNYISIPLQDQYRIIFKRTVDAQFAPYGVYSHEAYNRVVAQLR